MNPTDLVADVRARLNAAPKGMAREIAVRTDLAYDTVLRIARGDRYPRIKTLQKLHDALLAIEGEAAEKQEAAA